MKKTIGFLACLVSLVAYGQDEIMINGNPCGMHGSSKPGRKEYDLNVLKNRYKIPSDAEIDKTITLEKLASRAATADKFSTDKAVEVTGYVFDIKVGGVETCNCKATDPSFRDTHVELTLSDKKTGPGDRVIAEVTPRIRQMILKTGEDWTTHTLQHTLKGHWVKIRGWLLYDAEHEYEAFANDPGDNAGRKNWRATCWEIHPITYMEILDPEESMPVTDPYDKSPEVTAAPPVPAPPAVPVENKPVSGENTNPSSSITNQPSEPMETTTPFNLLAVILIGAILGGVGQGIRVIVGLKKVYDEALKKKVPAKDLLEYKQLLLSLVIGFAIGAIAGVLAAVSAPNIHLTKVVIFAFIGAGYAGTDFIEGFIKKNPVKQ